MNIFLTTVAAVLIFAVLVLVHEFGHFVAAKLSNVKVNEFALGMGPKLFGVQKGETLYSVRLIPLGGFCAMEGEDTDCTDARAFGRKKPYIRLIILVAGAFMNLLLGFILLFSLSLGSASFIAPKIERVEPNSAAQHAGILPGDTILAANGKRVHIIEDLSWAMSNNPDEQKTLSLVVKNGGEKREITVTPNIEDAKVSYGILLKEEQNSFFRSLRNSAYKTSFYGGVIIESFIGIIKGDIPLSQISGPVGIVSEIGTAVEATRTEGLKGFYNLLHLTILLTINLGVFNLFPLPALDGGRILFVLIELVRRKPLPAEKEAVVHFVGLVLLLFVSVLIAFKDVFAIWF